MKRTYPCLYGYERPVAASAVAADSAPREGSSTAKALIEGGAKDAEPLLIVELEDDVAAVESVVVEAVEERTSSDLAVTKKRKRIQPTHLSSSPSDVTAASAPHSPGAEAAAGSSPALSLSPVEARRLSPTQLQERESPDQYLVVRTSKAPLAVNIISEQVESVSAQSSTTSPKQADVRVKKRITPQLLASSAGEK